MGHAVPCATRRAPTQPSSNWRKQETHLSAPLPAQVPAHPWIGVKGSKACEWPRWSIQVAAKWPLWVPTPSVLPALQRWELCNCTIEQTPKLVWPAAALCSSSLSRDLAPHQNALFACSQRSSASKLTPQPSSIQTTPSLLLWLCSPLVPKEHWAAALPRSPRERASGKVAGGCSRCNHCKQVAQVDPVAAEHCWVKRLRPTPPQKGGRLPMQGHPAAVVVTRLGSVATPPPIGSLK